MGRSGSTKSLPLVAEDAQGRDGWTDRTVPSLPQLTGSPYIRARGPRKVPGHTVNTTQPLSSATHTW